MLVAGSTLGPYKIIAPIGSGGMGEVYRARDTRLSRDVALKVIHAEVAREPERIKRFEQEARAAGALSHPNICAIYDLGTFEGSPFVVMELLEGESLRAKLEAGPVPVRKALDYIAQAARGLAVAHEKGIVHRDLKPENLFVTKDGRLKVLDFGLAKLTRPEVMAGPGEQLISIAATETGAVLGTAGYMSPEQVRGQAVDSRSDLFALGAILHELLTGKRAFQGASYVETLHAILNNEPDSLSSGGRDVLPGLDPIVRRCLEKSPAERFQSASDLAFALKSLAGSGVESASPRAARRLERARGRLVVAFLAGTLLTALLAFLIAQRARPPQPTFTKLSFGKGVVGGARFTPDGNSVIYSARWGDSTSSQLFSTRIDAPGATAVRLHEAAGLVGVSGGEAAALMGGRATATAVGSPRTLATIPLTGGGARPVMENVLSADWAGDTKRLAVVRAVAGGRVLEYPPGKVLFSTAGSIGGTPRISPSGDRVAFTHTVFGESHGAVMVSDTNGRVMTLSKGWQVTGLAWSRDGSEVWFSAGTVWGWYSIRAVDLNGRVRTVFRAPSSLIIADVARDGRVLLSSGTQTNEIWGRAPGATTEQSFSWLDGSGAFGVSADGSSLLFTEISAGGGLNRAVYLRRFDGSPPVRLGEGRARGLSPDGAWALSVVQTPKPALLVIPTGAGETRTMPPGPIVGYYWACFFPDGRRVLIVGNEKGGRQRLFIQDLAAGPPKRISKEGVWVPETSSAVSPNGARIAALDGDRPVFVPVDGGDPSPIEGLAPGDLPFAWTRDGKSLFVAEVLRQGGQPVVRFDLASRSRIPWKVLRPPDRAGAFVPYLAVIAQDGEVYFYTVFRSLTNLFLVEGLK